MLSPAKPLFVLAGAGTGKTRVIAYRIAHQLREDPDLQPEQILALTFSRKAAQEMRDRVERLIGSAAGNLSIFTFHGFCQRFLQDHAVRLGLPGRFRLLDEADAWLFFRRHLAQMRLKFYWSVADPEAVIGDFLKVFSRAKDELVSPRDLAAYAEGLSDPQQRDRLREVARAYRIYQDRMRQAGNLDFGDLLTETLAAFRRQPALLAEARRRFRHVLVDEFQDTNVAQIELLKVLVGEGGSLCVVGDDDQAIYRFRGASFASFLLMREAFPGVRTVRLTRNYRSSRRILTAAERLIRHNEPDRFDVEKRLRAIRSGGAPVEVHRVRDEAQEAEAVADRLADLCAGADPKSPPVSVAVLYRAHAHRGPLCEALRARGIPFRTRGGVDLFREPVIRDLMSYLRLLHDPAASVELLRLLSHPAWEVPPLDLMTLSRAARERGVPVEAVLADSGKLPVGEAATGAASALLRELEGFRRLAVRGDPVEWVTRLAEDSFLRVVFRSDSGSRAEGQGDPLVSLGRFLRLTHRIVRNHPEASTPEAFLEHLAAFERTRLPDFSQEEEEEPEGPESIQLMTVHQAKGLEFDWVILIGMTEGRFPLRPRQEAIPFPVDLMKESLPRGNHHLQEERRLCYVACTRARRRLILMTQDRSYRRPSQFIREIREGAGEELRLFWADEAGSSAAGSVRPAGLPARLGGGSLKAEREVLQWLSRIQTLERSDEAGFEAVLGRIRQIAAGLRGARRRAGPLEPDRPVWRPEVFRFSFTQLDTFRTCPRKYLYQYLYRIPIRPTPELCLGEDLHRCLELFYRRVTETEAPPLSFLLEGFDRLHAPGRYGSDPEQDERVRAFGRQILSGFYRAQAEGEGFRPALAVERVFTLRVQAGCVHGVVDRIDPLPGGGVEILDYKSGKPKSNADPMQLHLYALAARQVMGLEPRRVSFYYLRDNSRRSFDPDPATLEAVRQKISDLTRQIASSDFAPAPNRFKCRRCDFKNLCPASQA